MSLVHVAYLVFSVTLAFAASAESPPSEGDVKSAAKKLVSDIRTMSHKAKEGIVVSSLLQEALDLQTDAANLIQQLPGDVPECETSLVIKMAAAGTGSHEVLTLLLAEDPVSVLNGRLSLSLAFLERVAQQLEDELALSNDIGAQLSAIVFGTNATATIAQNADDIVTKVVTQTSDNKKDVRRLLEPLKLGDSGFTLGLGGLTWTSSNGRTSFNVRPTFDNGNLGAYAGVTFRF